MRQRLVGLACICIFPLSLISCTSYAKFIDTLNTRELASCIAWQGQFSAGSMWGGAVNVRGFTVTGGADMAECQSIMTEERL